MKLSDFASNTYSQFGEDGVLSKVLEVLGIGRGFVVEFGAGDGLELSNTAQFWRDRRWPALLIEPNPERWATLKQNVQGFDVLLSNAYIEPTGRNAIDNFVDRDVLFMSIDVDDCDYQIFEGMKTRPKLVLVEFNYTMPHHLEMVGKTGSKLQASPLSVVKLAERKGYQLLSITGCNCLFVEQSLGHLFEEFDTSYKNLVDPGASTFVVTDWLGRYFFVGPRPHGMTKPYLEPPLEPP